MPTDILVVWNKNAGRVDGANEVRQKLEAEPGTELVVPAGPQEAIERVERACQDGVKRIVAAGGDGTINSVINGMANAPPDVALGVLPLGTANDWCASLGIPDDPRDALALVKYGDARPLDVAELVTQSRVMRFANIATGGNSHRVTESITSEQKQAWGAMCYLVNGLPLLGDLHSFDTTIHWSDGTTTRQPVWNLIVANGQTSAGRIRIAPRAKLDDGLLDVVVVEEGTLIDIASLTSLYLFDEYLASEKITYRKAEWIEVRSQPPIKFSIDGDLVDDEPIRFQVVPGAVQVIVGENPACVNG